MVSPNTKKEILKMAAEIVKGRVSDIDSAYTDLRQSEAAEVVRYTETIYKGLKSLCEREGIN